MSQASSQMALRSVSGGASALQDRPRVHVIGAGLSGLSAALGLAEAGLGVTLYEAAMRAGGRCRTFWDERLSLKIDNGNHFILSGNHAALDMLRRNGARDPLIGPPEAVFPFADIERNQHYCVRPGRAITPLWAIQRDKSVPGFRWSDIAEAPRLFLAGPERTLAQTIHKRGDFWRGFWEPMSVAVLNTDPEVAQASALVPVFARTFLRGGAFCRPLIAREGLGDAFVDPALARLSEFGADVRFGARVKSLAFADQRVTHLHIADEALVLSARDFVVLAVPPQRAGDLLPGLQTPEDGETILNAHFRVEGPIPDLPFGSHLLGVLGAKTQWIALRGNHVSLTISAAGALADLSEEELLPQLWRETCLALRLDPERNFAAGRLIKEKRATILATPANLARRPGCVTPYANLMLAGDWTATGLPATIEGAIHSGNVAAALIRKRLASM